MSENGKSFTRRQEPLSREAKVYDYRHEPSELMGALLSVFMRPDIRPPAPRELATLAPKRILHIGTSPGK